MQRVCCMRVYDPETALFYDLDGPEVAAICDDYGGAYSYDRRNKQWVYTLTYGKRILLEANTWPLNAIEREKRGGRWRLPRG